MTGSSAATRPLAGICSSIPPFIVVVDVGLAVGDHEHLGAGQLLLEQGAQGGRRPFDLDALGITALDIELIQQRLNLAIEFGVSGGDCRRRAKVLDLRLDRAPPAAEEAKDNRRGEQAQAGGDADQRQREIEPGLPGSRIDEGEVVQQYDASLLVAGGDRENAHEIAALIGA